eukprot:s299_g30.t1
MATAGESSGPVRYFSGESEDPQEYQRWKIWCQNKLLTLDKLPKNAAGAFVYTLLTGKALECVEHLDASSYQVEGGEKQLFTLLDQRFPDKDKTDELGELLTEVFALKVQSNETVKGWIGRASELFDRLNRKTQEIGRAFRSCYPDLVLGSRKSSAVHLVEDTSIGDAVDDEPELEFNDVEQFLTEHGHSVDGAASAEQSFQESDIAEVLAVTWKEKRAEINRLQKARKFQQVKEAKRQFRIEVEEIKRRSKCHRCHKQGHWARLLKAAVVQGSSPLLVSRPALRALQAKIDFDKDEMLVFQDQLRIPLTTNSAGQFVLNMMQSRKTETSAEVLMNDVSETAPVLSTNDEVETDFIED